LPLWRIGQSFLVIGATSFGGQASALAILERELVDRRQVLTSEDIAAAWAATRFLPGSTLVQVVSWIGYRLGGWAGSMLATAVYLLPPVIVMVLLGVFYEPLSRLPHFGPATQGLAAAVAGLMGAMTYRAGRKACSDPFAAVLALGAFGAALSGRVPAAVIVGIAGLLGALGPCRPPGKEAGGEAA
jgi:chromate transporter